MLSPYRLLDLTDDRGLLCGHILGQLGADVIHVEPLGGSPARRRGPFLPDVAPPEASLYWQAYTTNQRSVVLDLDTRADQQRLRTLVQNADFLIESADPGVQARRGLSYDDLAAINPALVYVSITSFGQTGPKAQWAATDLIVMAAGGPLFLNGDADRAPVRISVPQAYLHAGAEGALAALIAHHERVRSGRGQHVDVSAQAAMTAATQSMILATLNSSLISERASGGQRIGPFFVRFVYPARDGYVSITHGFGPALGAATRRLMECVYEAGFCDAARRDKDWIQYTQLLLTGQEPVEEFERAKQAIADFTSSRTRAELQQLAVERHLLVAPIASVADVLAEEQFHARGYWTRLDSGSDTTLLHPGPFARFDAAATRSQRRAPRLGEHGADLLGDTRSVDAPKARVAGTTPAEQPLAGVKILDLMWVMAGPQATRVLADFGATVIRVESPAHTDVCRTILPFQNGDQSNPVAFFNYNASKQMISLDLSTPTGRAVLLDLVRWADVVCEAFAPRVMRGWGFDYESLRLINPNLIMLSTCLMGQSGPLTNFAGYGNLAAAVTGFYSLGGWPDRPPVGAFGAYTDYIAWRYNGIALLAALEYRQRTGRGQHIDLSQAEAALHFLTPALLECEATGRVQGRDGNHDPQMAPHGVYPALGDDRWIALAAEHEDQWRSLCDAMGDPDLAVDPRFATLAGRLANREELDRVMAAWTVEHRVEDLEVLLQARRVPASGVQDSAALGADPQLWHRRHFVSVPNPAHGSTTIESARFLLSRTPGHATGSVPTLGRDNYEILTNILGYDEQRITALVAAGVVES